MSDTPSRTIRLPREERREHFLDVAARLVAEGGVDAVTMEGVASAAGVSKGLGYAYFTNADDLVLALLQRELGKLGAEMARAVRTADGFEAKSRAAIHAWFDAVAERGPLLGALTQAGVGRGPAEQTRKGYNRQMEEFWGEVAERELGTPRRQASIVAAVFIAGTRGLLERWVECRDPRTLLEDTYVEAIMGALRGIASKS